MNDMNTPSPSPEAAKSKCACDCDCGPTFAFLLLRIWLAVRAIVTGIEKYAGTRVVGDNVDQPSGAILGATSEKYYSLKAYAAIPKSMADKFATEPLLPGFATSALYAVLGPALILLGLMLLLGIGTRISLFVQGLIYTMLTVGLILIKQDAGVAWLAIHIALIAGALVLAKYNKFAILRKW